MRKCAWWPCVHWTKDEFCSRSCASKYRVDRHRRVTRYRLQQELGGKCSRCGYSGCPEALEFHHRDPQEKEFGIGSRGTNSFETLLGEVKKCQLLCSNCHREIGYEANRDRWIEAIEWWTRLRKH